MNTFMATTGLGSAPVIKPDGRVWSRNVSICLCEAERTYEDREEPRSRVSAVANFQSENRGREDQSHDIRKNNRRSLNQDTIDQPQEDTGGNGDQHYQRHVFGEFRFPGLGELRQERQGRQDACDEPNDHDEIKRRLLRRVSVGLGFQSP